MDEPMPNARRLMRSAFIRMLDGAGDASRASERGDGKLVWCSEAAHERVMVARLQPSCTLLVCVCIAISCLCVDVQEDADMMSERRGRRTHVRC